MPSLNVERGPDRGAVDPAWASVRALRRPAVALVAFVFLAILHTWPLATDPAHLSRTDNADMLLNAWDIAWVAHQLPRDPRHLFDANIFYPERGTLGYSEAMPIQGVLAMPVLGLGGSPVLAFNLVFLAGLSLTGWAFWLLIRRWTASTAAAYVGGALAAFNSHVLVRLPHLQTQHVEFIAIVLFALDALIVARRPRHAVLLGVGFAAQALTSMYLMVFTVWMLVFAAAARLREMIRRDPVRMLRLGLLAVVVAAVLLAPYLAAYVEVHRLQGFQRDVDDARAYTGQWTDYLTTGSRLYFPLFGEKYFNRSHTAGFPGFGALLLVGLALGWPETRRDPRVRMCLAAAVGCAAVAMAPQTPIYPWLYRAVPLFRIVRVIAHLAQIVLLMVAVVAAFGLTGLLRRCGPRTGAAVALAAFAVVNLEALRAPLTYEPFSRIPPIYDVLAGGRGAVAELPMAAPNNFHLNAGYMLASTRYWRPLLDGYSGFRPGSYDDTYAAVRDFPAPAALAALHARGVTAVIVHRDQFSPEQLTAMQHVASLELVAEDGPLAVYRLR